MVSNIRITYTRRFVSDTEVFRAFNSHLKKTITLISYKYFEKRKWYCQIQSRVFILYLFSKYLELKFTIISCL